MSMVHSVALTSSRERPYCMSFPSIAQLLREPLSWRLDADRLELWNSKTNVVLRES